MDFIIAILINATAIILYRQYLTKRIRKEERIFVHRVIIELIQALNEVLPEITVTYNITPFDFDEDTKYPHTHTSDDLKLQKAFNEIIKRFDKE